MVEDVSSSLEVNILRLYDRVVLSFTDNSSEDCQEISRNYEKAAKHPKCQNVLFVKAELGEAKEVFEEYKIESTPVFMFFKDGLKTDEVLGNDSDQLKKKIAKFIK